jgi:hypothetical protein
MNGISYYDSARRIPAKPYYQRLHVELLKHLYSVYPKEVLASFALRWEQGFIEKWGFSTWLQYATKTVTNGLKIDGVAFPFHALSYSLGDLGISLRSRLGPKRPFVTRSNSTLEEFGGESDAFR